MTAIYLETSALLTWLLGEPGEAKVREEVDAAEAVATSALTFLEAERALVRAVASGTVREADTRRLRGMLARQRASWLVMTVSEAVLDRAARPFPVEPVRTLDALHLATALVFSEALPDLRVLSLDRRVTENAAALGL
jgi:predicted nucleic acid-binding protein